MLITYNHDSDHEHSYRNQNWCPSCTNITSGLGLRPEGVFRDEAETSCIVGAKLKVQVFPRGSFLRSVGAGVVTETGMQDRLL